MNTATKKNTVTPKHQPGFCQRLDTLMDAAHCPRRGRQAEVSRLCEMSVPGTKDLLDNDRPPKQKKHFDKLVKGLAALLRQRTGRHLSQQQLRDYLLEGTNNPLAAPVSYFPYPVDQVDPIYSGQIYLLINQIGEQLGIDIYQTVDRPQLLKAYETIFTYCAEHQPTIESPTLREIITSSLTLANAKMLK